MAPQVKKEEIETIAQAGKPNKLTISTVGMLGRGVDIHSDYLDVLSAYVPTEEDEIQIKGRTARFGKPGEYRMIVNMSDSDYPLNGRTYNVYNEVHKSQKQRQQTEANLREITSLYAFFLEDVTLQFLADHESCSEEEKGEQLEKWQQFLSKMQKDWESHRQQLHKAVCAEDKEQFSTIFNAFTEKWLKEVPVKEATSDAEQQAEDISTIYTAITAQQRFFTPQRQAIKVQSEYDPSDDGQARVYTTLFAQTRATLRGDRPLLANFHAWREGRGQLFPDLMAVLHGDRMLFANLYATICRWIEEFRAWYNGAGKVQMDGVDDVSEPVLDVHYTI